MTTHTGVTNSCSSGERGDDAVIVELKAVVKLLPIHEAQLLSYLKLSGYRVGLLINFHVPHLKDGITRMVNNL